jgi:hypothetical protein
MAHSVVRTCVFFRITESRRRTTDVTDSLLDNDIQQTLLPDEDVIRFVPDDPRNPLFTAERFFSTRGSHYRLIVQWCCVDGLSVNQVADALGCSRNLVSQIVLRESASKSVEQLRLSAAREYGHLARLSREYLTQVVLSLPDPQTLTVNQRVALCKVLALVTGVSTDKQQVMSGGVTSRVEVVDNSPTPAEVVAYLRGLQTGLEGGKEGPKCIEGDSRVIPAISGECADAPGGGNPIDPAVLQAAATPHLPGDPAPGKGAEDMSNVLLA